MATVTELAIRRTLMNRPSLGKSTAEFRTTLYTARGIAVELRFSETGSPEITLASKEPSICLSDRELQIINDLQSEVSAMWDKISETIDQFNDPI